jgi:phage shock protein C
MWGTAPAANTGRMTTTTPTPVHKPTRLTRRRHDRMIAGVCGGIADYFGTSATTVRVLAVLSCLLPGPQFIAYLVAWALIPLRDE